MTRQQSSDRETIREEEEEQGGQDKHDEDEDDAQGGLMLSEQSRGRWKHKGRQNKPTDARPMLQARPLSPPQKWTGEHPVSPNHQPHIMSPKSESPMRKRLMSPFRLLRERSQSRERLRSRPQPDNNREQQEESEPSLNSEERTETEPEQRGRRSVSPNPFLWLCVEKRNRTKDSPTQITD